MTWSGVLEPVTGNPLWRDQWRITSVGTVANPTGPAVAPVARTTTAIVPVVIPEYVEVNPATSSLNWVYAFWLGERIVAPVVALSGVAREVIACHHERWNGSGYPRGLRGLEIPLAARIFALVDAFDAITHNQPYREALGVEAAREEIHAKAGIDFDPELAQVFLALDEVVEPAELAFPSEQR